MRPLLVSHTGIPGGSNQVILALLAHRPADIHPACVFLSGGDTAARARALDVPAEVIHAGRAREAWRAPAVVHLLRRAIRAHRADVVFSHTAKSHVYAGAAAALEGVPCLWWQHALPGNQRLLERAARAWPTSAIVCSSDFTAALQRQRTPGVPVHRIYPGTDVPSAGAGARSDSRHVGMVTRLQRYKRVELLLHAVPLVLAEEPKAIFSILGGGDPAVDPGYPDELSRLISELGVGSAVTLYGHVDEPSQRIETFDLLVHTAHQEPFGLVYLEAMARGRPVIGPAEGGSTEIIRADVDGLLVNVTSARCLADAITALLRDPRRRAAMGSEGRQRVIECFTVELMAATAWPLVSRVSQEGAPAGRRLRAHRRAP